MGSSQSLDTEFAKGGNCLLHLIRGGTEEMGAANYSIDLLYPGQFLSMFQGVDNAPMGTTKDNHQTLLSPDDESLIIQELIRA